MGKEWKGRYFMIHNHQNISKLLLIQNLLNGSIHGSDSATWTYVFFRITQFPVDSTGVLRALVVANGTDLSIHHVDAILRDEVLVWDPKNGTCLVDPVDPCFISGFIDVARCSKNKSLVTNFERRENWQPGIIPKTMRET